MREKPREASFFGLQTHNQEPSTASKARSQNICPLHLIRAAAGAGRRDKTSSRKRRMRDVDEPLASEESASHLLEVIVMWSWRNWAASLSWLRSVWFSRTGVGLSPIRTAWRTGRWENFGLGSLVKLDRRFL